MIAFLLRFVGAGLVVACLPLVAAQFGDRVAGLMLLFPILTMGGFLVLGLDRGTDAVARASLGSLIALPVVAAFLLAVHLTARYHLALAWVLSIGGAVWLMAAGVFVALTISNWSEQ